jgi:hypothetical protein
VAVAAVAVTAVEANISEMSALRANLYIHIPGKEQYHESEAPVAV